MKSLAHPRSASRSRGFTLIESVVVLAIVATLMSLAGPALGSAYQSAQVTSATNEMLASLVLARGEAIRRNSRVSMCMSQDGQNCTTSGNWRQGWIVFADPSGFGQRDASETIIQRTQALGSTLVVSGNQFVASVVSYLPDGSVAPSAGGLSNGTVTICISGSKDARKLTLNQAGRPRVDRIQLTACA